MKPRVYIAPDYDEEGKWLYINDFDTYKDFIAACEEISLAYVYDDFVDFPGKWFQEIESEETFNKIQEFADLDGATQTAFFDYMIITGDDNFDSFYDSYEGYFDSPMDFAHYIVDNMELTKEMLLEYFDLEKFTDHLFRSDFTMTENNFVFSNLQKCPV